MSKREPAAHTVELASTQLGGITVLTWHVYRARVGEPHRTLWKTRRCLLTGLEPLTVPQLTVLGVRMGGFVLQGQAGTHAVPRCASWIEVGGPRGPVPPGGGEGGENRAYNAPYGIGRYGDRNLTERGIRS